MRFDFTFVHTSTPCANEYRELTLRSTRELEGYLGIYACIVERDTLEKKRPDEK